MNKRRWLCPFCERTFYSINREGIDQHIGETHAEHSGLSSHELACASHGVWLQRMRRIAAIHGARCLSCGRVPDAGTEFYPLTLDHVEPLGRGGADDIANWQMLCTACNQEKADMVIDFRAALGEEPHGQ